MKLKYMRDNLPDTYGLLELQDKILEIAVYMDDLCEKHNNQYNFYCLDCKYHICEKCIIIISVINPGVIK